MRMDKSIAIITARGGSKRIPGKNIKMFCGKPIIEYSIREAIKSGQFDEVMVSTDSNEIGTIAKNCGAKIPFMRSKELASDTATTDETLMGVLNDYKKMGQEFKYMCCIYPTAQIIPMVKYSFPPQRCNYIDKNGYAHYKFEEYRMSRTQDFESWYHDAGQFYVYNIDKFYKCNGDCKEIIPIVVPEMEVQDIDTEEDWELAEIKYMLMQRKTI